MTAIATEAETVSTGIIEAWALYRRSQLIPAGTPDIINARAGLLRLLEPHTRTLGPAEATAGDLEAIDDAADRLVNLIEFRLDTETADRVAGDAA